MKKFIAVSVLFVILFGWRTVIANVFNIERIKSEYASSQECTEASNQGFMS